MKTPLNPPSIIERFDALLISTDIANKLVGKRAPGTVTYEESEQGDARRRLLHVEKLAIKQKTSEAQAHAEKVEAVSNELHNRILNKLNPQFFNSTIVASSILGLTDDVTELLDILSTRACSVSRIEPLVGCLPWLHEAILKDINSPQNRRLDAKGKPIIIESIRTALSTLGIENLKKIIPYFVFKYCIPQVTDPYPQIKTKFAEYYLGVANASSRLASQQDVSEFNAYILGMLAGLGRCASIRQYFREFDKTLREYAQEAMAKRDQDTYGALQLVQPSPTKLSDLMRTFSRSITERAFEHMLFRRINMLGAWTEDDHLLYQINTTAQKFTQLKMLIRYRLVDRDMAKSHLTSLKINPSALEELNKPELFKLATERQAT